MTCEQIYTLPCGVDCGEWCLPFNAPYTGLFTLEWEIGETVYKKTVSGVINEPLCFLWPFPTYGEFIFKVYDKFLEPITYEHQDITYDCWRAVAIPTYDINPEDLEYLMALCAVEPPFVVEFDGSGHMSVLFEMDPPPGDDDWEMAVEFEGSGHIEIDFVVEDQPDVEMGVEFEGKGSVDIALITLGDPPGFAYLLNGEDLVMVAYSQRRLWPGYNGFCCRVMRHSDSATLDVGFSGGWRDDAAISNFLKGQEGGVAIWYNQFGAGGNLIQNDPGQQFKVTDGSGNIYKKLINLVQYPAFDGLNGVANWAPATAGGWNGNKHTVHYVVFLDGNTEAVAVGTSSNPPFPAGSYTGYVGAIVIPHHLNVGTPFYYVNNVAQANDGSQFMKVMMIGQGSHVWIDDNDLSLWTDIGAFLSWEEAVFELVVFNEDKKTERTLKTNNTMPVYGL